MTSELTGLKVTLAQSQEKEKKSVCLLQEFTAMVREQKDHISELLNVKRDVVVELKVRCHGDAEGSLESLDQVGKDAVSL